MRHFSALLLSAIALAAPHLSAAEETTLFDFSKDLSGFYCFKNDSSQMTLSHVKDSANGSSGSLRSDHNLKGNSAYGGIGIGFDYIDRKLSQWAPFGAQGAVWLAAKASSPDELEVKLLAKEGTYSLRVKVEKEWARYTLPFRFFENGERKAFDPTAMSIQKMEIRPSKRNTKGALLIDAIGLKSDVQYEPRDEIFEANGLIADAKDAPVNDALVEVLTERADVYGWYPVLSVRTQADGRIALRCITRKATRYIAELLDAEGKPLATADRAPGAQPHVLEVACSGFKTQRMPIRVADAAKYADLKIALVPVDDAEAAITVVPDEKLREINPLVYGANVGLWHAGDFRNPNVVAAAKEAGITIIRYPGGARSQGARWQRKEAAWDSTPVDGKGNCVLTPAKVDEFIEFCRQVGAEPMISLNLESRDAANAADLIRFLNVEKKYGVKYFEFGNEPECYAESWEMGKNWTHDKDVLGKTYAEVARVHKEFAAMLKEIDPAALDMGPVSANADFFDLAIPPFWESIGSTMAVLSVHRYPQTDQKAGNGHWDDAKLLRAPLEWAELCGKLQAMERKYSPDKHPLLAVTEWNTCYHTPGPRQQQIVGALYTARNLGEMIRNGVDIANYWVLTGCGAYNLFNTSGKGVEKTLPYHTFALFSNHLRGTLIKAQSGNPDLSVYAARNGQDLVLAFVNVSPERRFHCKPDLDPAKYRLQAAYVVERNRPYVETAEPKDLVVPAYSVVLARYRPAAHE